MKRLASLVFALLLTPVVCVAASLPSPQGEVVLTVSGKIDVRNHGSDARFDIAMLEALPRRTVESYTHWDQGRVRYEGFLLRDLIERVGASGSRVTASALNDYEIDLPLSDAGEFDVLVVYKREGEYMAVRDKGPLWIIYPSDRPDAMRSHNDKMVWQLNRLVFR